MNGAAHVMSFAVTGNKRLVEQFMSVLLLTVSLVNMPVRGAGQHASTYSWSPVHGAGQHASTWSWSTCQYI